MDQPNPWAPAGAPPPSPPKPRTALIIGLSIGLAAVLVVAAGVFGFSYLMSQRHDSTQPQNVDEMVLRQVPGDDEPRKFGGTAVYDACSMITISQLADLGVSLATDGSVTHEHLDSDVAAGDAVPQDSTDSVSYCYYPLVNGNSLTVSVHQTPFNNAADLQTERARSGVAPRVENGLSLAQWHDEDVEAQLIDIWRPDLLIEVTVGTNRPGPYGTMDAKTLATKLEPLVTTAIAKGPTAPMRHVYTGPLSEVRHPCEVANTTAFRRAFPSHAGAAAMVEADFYPDMSNFGGEREGLMSCTRNNIVPNGSLNQAEYRELHVAMSVAETLQAASTNNTALCTVSTSSSVIEVVAVSPSVGTGRTCLMRIGTDWELKFQLNQVNISIRGPLADSPTADERRSQLLPAAQAIAEAGVTR